MSRETWIGVDCFLVDSLVGSDPLLDSVLAASAEAGLPEIHVAPNQGKLLYLLARSCGATQILEIGTLGGYSTIWLARALPPHGRLVTLEVDAKHAAVARNNFAAAGLNDMIELREGRAADTLQQLKAEGAGPFDLVFIDADKPSAPEYLSLSLQLSRPGTIVVVDNMIRAGKVIDAESTDANVQGARRLIETIGAEPRVTATAIQTVGSKGYDGFVIALVNDI